MESEVDINSIASELLTNQFSKVFEKLTKAGKGLTNKLHLAFVASFHTYVDRIVARHSKARSFFNRGEPVNLYSFYVPIGVCCEKHSIPRVNANALFHKTRNIVIQGSGGCGKSVVIRHILLDILNTRKKLPIFIELRDMNRTKETLNELLLRSLKESGLDIENSTFAFGLEDGLFALLFDGFDELDVALRSQAATAIRSIASANHDNWIVVTSRPDHEFSGWSEFSIYTSMPLSLDQATDLVQKTPIEEELKNRFIEDLQTKLFQLHQSFLSNPLLLSIMLLTYHDSADIPTKLSVFYTQAYDALFQRHDAWKGGYKRVRECKLDIHDFARVFSAFSMLTYDARMFTFPKSAAIGFVKDAQRLSYIDVESEAFLQDAIQAVCLLVEDGLQVSYSHRSFQEFFAARFVADASPSIKGELLGKLARNLRTDAAMGLTGLTLLDHFR
jgi:predicted NACHT family NTPase